MDSNSYSPDQPLDSATESLIAARDRTLGPSYRLFYERPVHLVRGSGTRLYDADGDCYLDAYNNVACVGHCHPPRCRGATSRQLATLNTHTRYLHEGIVAYSERLLATMPDPIDRVMYACTGSEVNDLALRVARNAPGATGVIITADAYHGNTAAVTAIRRRSAGPPASARMCVPSPRRTATAFPPTTRRPASKPRWPRPPIYGPPASA